MSNWPDPARFGVPLNPDRSGWHWLKGLGSLSKPRPFFWEVFLGPGQWADQRLDDPVILAEMEYLGPVATPAEIAAKDARIAELKAALRVYECSGKCANCYGAVRNTKYCGQIARAALVGGGR